MMAASKQDGGTRWGILGAIFSAVVASICCLGPFVVLLLGVGGAWATQLTALQPYRPIFIGLTLLFLGYAFYRVYGRSPDHACEPGQPCADPRVQRRNRWILWVVTILIGIMLLLPYGISSFHTSVPQTVSSASRWVTLELQNMTCSSCVVAVEKSLTSRDGIVHVAVTLDPPRARVQFDPRQITVEEIQQATTEIGFPSSVLTLPQTDKQGE
ncbi:MAG: hypothetical protein GXO78_12375 [Calditrichaeota bacterium]|nr:hypothetical protein [Calditrichota bacterium]